MGDDTGRSSHVAIKVEEEQGNEPAQEEVVNEQTRKRERLESEALQQGVSTTAGSRSPQKPHPSWGSPSTQPNKMARLDNVALQGQAEAGIQLQGGNSRMLAPGARNFGQHPRRDDAVRPVPVPWLKLVLDKPGMEHLQVHPGHENNIVRDMADQASNFLKAHLATVELCRGHDSVPGSTSSSLFRIARAKEEAAARFAEQQLKCQPKGLLEQDPDSITLHTEALDTALQVGSAGHAVSMPRAKCLHHMLKGTGGRRFRRTRIREWDQHCPAPEDVEQMLRENLDLAERLWWRQDVDLHTKAAAVAMAVVQVHPFEDGNGRLARILVNQVLRRAGVPFTVCLATVSADEQERLVWKNSIDECILRASLTPMASMILDHASRAWWELKQMQDVVAQQLTDKELATMMKEARQKAVKETCCICLSDGCNMSLLCCGAPTHLNCMANWLAMGPSPACMQCREPLPAPSQRIDAQIEDQELHFSPPGLMLRQRSALLLHLPLRQLLKRADLMLQ